jgi:hypothetical protein
MRRVTAFSWGYWGWGTHAPELVRQVDAIERRRGRRSPIFADIRYKRNVRAPGFRGGAFEKLVGKGRYRWLRKLGNANIGTKKKEAKIADPSAVEELRRLVLDAHKQKRGVIFFCSCESACNCHRAIVARLLRTSAARKHTPITVIEWPGGEPETVQLPVSSKIINGVLRGGNRVPLNDVSSRMMSKLQSLPWCSRVELGCDDTVLGIVSGPAKLAEDWYLPVIGPQTSAKTDTVRSLKGCAARLRKSEGYAPCS